MRAHLDPLDVPRSILGACLAALLSSCAGVEPVEPSPEFLSLCPQSIAVAEPYGGGDELERRARGLLRRRLHERGYELGETRAVADAELRFYLDEVETGRGWLHGECHATVALDAELLGPSGIVWQARGVGIAREHDDDPEERELYDDPAEIVFGGVFDRALDAVVEPDYEALTERALHDAVDSLLRYLPKRVKR